MWERETVKTNLDHKIKGKIYYKFSVTHMQKITENMTSNYNFYLIWNQGLQDIISVEFLHVCNRVCNKHFSMAFTWILSKC